MVICFSLLLPLSPHRHVVGGGEPRPCVGATQWPDVAGDEARVPLGVDMEYSRFNQVRHREERCTYAGLRSALPKCGIVALDCCFALFVVCLIGCYYIFKRNLFCSCATKPTPKIYEYMLTYTHMPIYFRLLASYKRSRLPFHLSGSRGLPNFWFAHFLNFDLSNPKFSTFLCGLLSLQYTLF